MFNTMFANYVATSAAMAYIVGFNLNGRAYMATVRELVQDWVHMDRESKQNGGTAKLRMALNNKQKVALIEAGAVEIGATADLLALHKNKGCAFEKYVTEKAGQTWVKDSVPYYLDGDLTVDGVKYQIKWENASLTNEKVIAAALAWKMAH